MARIATQKIGSYDSTIEMAEGRAWQKEGVRRTYYSLRTVRGHSIGRAIYTVQEGPVGQGWRIDTAAGPVYLDGVMPSSGAKQAAISRLVQELFQ